RPETDLVTAGRSGGGAAATTAGEQADRALAPTAGTWQAAGPLSVAGRDRAAGLPTPTPVGRTARAGGDWLERQRPETDLVTAGRSGGGAAATTAGEQADRALAPAARARQAAGPLSAGGRDHAAGLPTPTPVGRIARAGRGRLEEQRPEAELVMAGRSGSVLASAVARTSVGRTARAGGDWLEQQRPETDLVQPGGGTAQLAPSRTPETAPGGASNFGRVPGGGPAPTPTAAPVRPQPLWAALGLTVRRATMEALAAPGQPDRPSPARPAADSPLTAVAPQGGPDDGAAIDCLVTRHPHLPRDRMGHRLNDAGRWLITEAVASLYGVRLSPRELARDEHRRWSVPALGLTASVAHCAAYSTVALVSGQTVGVDLQDHRDRPFAMQWLGALLGRPDGEPATMRDFAECEALIKASHLRKETFAGVRLPDWQPGWRPTNVGHLVRSADLGEGLHLALATDAPADVRWWWQPEPSAPAVRTEALSLEAAA
ncbi:hypothetical protein ACIQF6_30400, partial [Kitasatospora sp. NPDC092948]|uniref:hypothetical protein n=1 Tax=Kitasatospora sp. NPDC092948 TaxID=3364088 RepID=UPI0037FF7A8A